VIHHLSDAFGSNLIDKNEPFWGIAPTITRFYKLLFDIQLQQVAGL
jgi:hypothetical protein